MTPSKIIKNDTIFMINFVDVVNAIAKFVIPAQRGAVTGGLLCGFLNFNWK
jgi:hypothetical protein